MKKITKRAFSFCIAVTLALLTLPLAMKANAAETPSSWAVERVNEAIVENLVPQSLQSNFTQAITRAEFCALAVVFFESFNGEITKRITFADTNDVNVEKAAAVGIVSGVGNNRFEPDETLTREQAAVILSNLSDAIRQPFPKEAAAFDDNGDVASWAIEGVGRAQAAKIMNGVGNNRFAPQQPFTREQSIITIMHTIDFVNARRVEAPLPQNAVNNYEKAPLLEVILTSGKNPLQSMPLQSIQAAQLTTNWVHENGSYMYDSPHPMQLSDYSDLTLHLDHENDQILLQFRNGAPPQSMSARRWNLEYYTGKQDISDILDKGEPVEVDGALLLVSDNGNDYIYEVIATWPEGRSTYAFRVNSINANKP